MESMMGANTHDADADLPSDRGLLINIDFVKVHRGLLVRPFEKLGRDEPAWAAPGGVEVDHDGSLLVGSL